MSLGLSLTRLLVILGGISVLAALASLALPPARMRR